ncbi:hypothetical protein BVX99_03080, partial [bacterium F16]
AERKISTSPPPNYLEVILIFLYLGSLIGLIITFEAEISSEEFTSFINRLSENIPFIVCLWVSHAIKALMDTIGKMVSPNKITDSVDADASTES